MPPSSSSYHRWDGSATAPPCVELIPGSVGELQRMVRRCNELDVAMVPQGGGTGLVDGGWPTGDEQKPVAAFSIAALNRVRAIDPANRTMIVEAGATVEQADAAANAHGLTFPMKIGSGGTAQIGGAVSTNAGGIRSWRHGNMRELVISVEAVLADGKLWSGLRSVRKATAGLDLSALLVGSEGILGIVTAAALRLSIPAGAHRTAFLALDRIEDAVTLFRQFESTGQLAVIELISGAGLAHFARFEAVGSLPVNLGYPWYLLVEWSAGQEDDLVAIENRLGAAMEAGLIVGGTLAKNETERAGFWGIRERHGRACRRAGRPVQHDVALPVSRLPEFLKGAEAVVDRLLPGVDAVPVCHLGDGNVHYDLLRPDGDPRDWSALAEVAQRIHDLAVGLGGSFSAEHGIGTHRRDELRRLMAGESFDAMLAVKAALDPRGLMNPGKVL